MIILTAGHDGNIISREQNILIATSCCQTQGILEIWKYSGPGSQVSGFDWVLQLSAGCQLVTWGSPVSGWHLILSWHPMSSCPWFVLSPGLITDNWLEPDIHISIVFTLSGPGPIKHDELLRKLGTQYTRHSGTWFIFQQPGWGSFNFIISGSPQITSECLILLPRITNEIWEGVRAGPGPCNQ